ncbi:MAG: hypothetical protein ND895_22535 [Pyrinomonadaceae bacterium]|nr:hypothetical protein [Pyrinomonadaceae bacterium]
MIKNLSKLFLALCLLTVGGGIVANAQIDSDITIEVSVPFPFVVDNTTLPAGKYEIRTIDDNTLSVLELRSVNGHTSVVFETDAAVTPDGQSATKTELVFDKVGGKDFLSQVWLAGSSSGSQLAKSRMEKKLEGRGGQRERHSLAAILRHPKR